MDPLQMLAFSERVTVELSALRPTMAEEFTRRAVALRRELKTLHRKIEARLRPFAGQTFFINHASLAHYAARYGLIQRSIEPVGSQPSPRRVAEMIQAAKSAGAGAILAQPQFSRSTADILARALGLPVLPVDPLRRDYPANLLEITERLEQALSPTVKEGAE
jgi:zinc transport system substrate-binding protein